MILRRLSYFIILISVLFSSVFLPYSTFALSQEKLNFYAPNHILFYNPENQNCPENTGNGIWKGAQYSFTNDELKRLWWAASSENGSGIETELSFFANIFEKQGGFPGDNQGLISKVTERYKNGGASGWFASTTGEAYETGRVAAWGTTYPEPTSEQILTAKDILNNGNRTIPPEINEHDSISDIESVTNNGVAFDKNDRSKYQSGVTVIDNRFGSVYTFYVWANGKKECTDNCGDPFGYTGEAPQESYSTVTTTGNNALYNNSPALSDAELQQIENNKKVYEEAAKEYNMPWQILAALHYREHSLQVSNPSNGQGIYQLYSYTSGGTNANRFEPGPVDEAEFLRQSKLAAGIFRGKVGDVDLTDSNNIKRAFFEYNGTASIYKQKARCMGFSEEEANNGEGSPYVMNMYDAKRDPNSTDVSPCWLGSYVGDGEYRASASDDRPGAYVIFSALGGEGSGMDKCNVEGNGNIIADTALKLSWDCGSASGCQPLTNPKPEYISAMQEVNLYYPFGAVAGASCDQFVATVMRSSGSDPDFNTNIASASGVYMLRHPEMYMEINFDNTNPEILMPGDIFSTYETGANGEGISGGHIWIYVKINGESGRADASYDERTGEHYISPNPLNYDVLSGRTRNYKVFRRINR